ncbi:MAG: VUT family protein [Alphaproteobacteria bacterium]|nr:VUT family protein [Alphaproteobacteria bacterium]
MTRHAIQDLAVPVLAMTVIVVASNILVQHPVNDWLTWGALSYPVSFLVTDLTNRRFGPALARRVVYVGFVLAVLLSVLFAGWRIALASGSAFLAAQLLDIGVFHRLRQGAWWRAPLVSSSAASALDTALFFSLAFAGTGVPWVTLGLGDFAVKMALALLMLVPFRALMFVVRARPA